MIKIHIDDEKLERLMKAKINPPREEYRYVIHSCPQAIACINSTIWPVPLQDLQVSDSLLCAIASEEVLAKDWLTEEEEKAWEGL